VVILESPYKRLSCECHTQMKCNMAVKLGPIWYVVLSCRYSCPGCSNFGFH